MSVQVIISTTEGVRVQFDDVHDPLAVAEFHNKLTKALIQSSQEVVESVGLADKKEEEGFHYLAYTTDPEDGSRVEYRISKEDSFFLKNLKASAEMEGDAVEFTVKEVAGNVAESYIVTEDGEVVILQDVINTVAEALAEAMKE